MGIGADFERAMELDEPAFRYGADEESVDGSSSCYKWAVFTATKGGVLVAALAIVRGVLCLPYLRYHIKSLEFFHGLATALFIIGLGFSFLIMELYAQKPAEIPLECLLKLRRIMTASTFSTSGFYVWFGLFNFGGFGISVPTDPRGLTERTGKYDISRTWYGFTILAVGFGIMILAICIGLLRGCMCIPIGADDEADAKAEDHEFDVKPVGWPCPTVLDAREPSYCNYLTPTNSGFKGGRKSPLV